MSSEEERVPLVSKNDLHNNDDSYNSGNSSADTSFRIPIYGTSSEKRPSVKPVPIEERIKYSWNSLNVFATADEPQSDTNFCFCCKSRSADNLQKKHLLKNVSGLAYPGELLAILGSSGAGKTTLLNALTFRSSKNVTVTGTRCVNGTPVNSKALTSQSAYVQQDELFIGSLTVKEHLRFQALVRMDKYISYDQRMQRVNEVITEMTLNKCENTCIGIPGRLKGISGGELKRLSFASEVLTNPSLMFCDEPTSGLDSFMALNVVQTLKNMAHAGKTVICTIHQPSSELYAMFDKLLLMTEGRIAFLGTPEEADMFFRKLDAPCPKNYNPADYFIQLLAIVPGNEESCRNAVSMICDKFQRSELGVQVALDSAITSGDFLTHRETDVWVHTSTNNGRSPYKASWCQQFRAVLWRSWLSIIKEPLLVRVRLFQTILVSLILGAIYYGQVINEDGVMNINGALFIFLTNMTFQNVFAVITVFSSELPIFLREHKNGMYRTDVYFLGKTIADIPIFIFLPLLFLSICYFLIGLNSEMPRFFVACGIIVLVANAATSFGYLISCISTTVSMALSIGPPLLLPFLLFGGFFLNIESIPVYLEWLAYLSWFKYGNEALMVNQWENVTNIQCPTVNSSCPRDGHVVLEMYNFKEEHLKLDILSLFGLIVLFRLAAYFALLWKTYKDTE
ncbi:protein white [Anthonomus grandis grandis]|uniref:protein white n=1 Tax=Anthonomus grandis grandis TaxID=2921223 RepID=UPI0021657CE0|nr:protein white [Anthonomus grandis grandis]